MSEANDCKGGGSVGQLVSLRRRGRKELRITVQSWKKDGWKGDPSSGVELELKGPNPIVLPRFSSTRGDTDL